jgi:hypothetical protein
MGVIESRYGAPEEGQPGAEFLDASPEAVNSSRRVGGVKDKV